MDRRLKSRARAAARFFIRVGRAADARRFRDEHTLPLFPLPLILDCEGLLAADAKHLAGK